MRPGHRGTRHARGERGDVLVRGGVRRVHPARARRTAVHGGQEQDGVRPRHPRRAGDPHRRLDARAGAGPGTGRRDPRRAAGNRRRPGRGHPQRVGRHQVRGAVRAVRARAAPARRRRRAGRPARGRRVGDQSRHGRLLAVADLARRRAGAVLAGAGRHRRVPPRRHLGAADLPAAAGRAAAGVRRRGRGRGHPGVAGGRRRRPPGPRRHVRRRGGERGAARPDRRGGRRR